MIQKIIVSDDPRLENELFAIIYYLWKTILITCQAKLSQQSSH